MKVRLFGRKYKRGVSTLEILIAFAVLALTMTAVIVVVFSNQSVSVDTQTNNEALGLAQARLEAAYAASKDDFYGLTNASSSVLSGPLSYQVAVNFADAGAFAKQATSTVTWVDAGRAMSVVLSTLFTDADGFWSGDTCSPTLTGDWTAPLGPSNGSNPGYGYYDFPSPDGTTGVDAAGGRAYVTTDPSSATRPDFYVVDVSDPNPPGNTLSSLGSFNTTYGLTSVQVSGNYAYVSADSAAYQLLILDKVDPQHISITGKLKVTPSGDSAYGNTLSLDYKAHRVYLGTNTSSGDEFYIINVADPANPVKLGSFPINAKVNQILVNGTTAYLATASTSQVVALDISNPASPQLERAFPDDSSGLLSGESLLLSGNTLYFGRIGGGNSAWHYPQLFSLNASTLAENWRLTTATHTGPTSHYDGVNRMILRSNLLFVAAPSSGGGFEIYDVSDPAHPPPRYDTNPVNIAQGTTAGFDCEGNYIFVGEGGNRALQIIGPS